MPIITIGRSRQFETMVSDADYDYLIQFLWTFAVSHPKGSLIYARRSIRVGPNNVTVLMHRVIMERRGLERPSLKHTVDHDDGDSLNNSRDNLFWRDGAAQMFNQRRHRAAAAAAALAEAPPPF